MNRFARRLFEQLESAIPPEGPVGLEQQAEDQALAGPAQASGAPEVARATSSTYDSRPLGSREFIFRPAAVQANIVPEGLTVWNSPEFTVPQGRVAVVRMIGYTIDPLPGMNGIRADHFQFSVLRNGDFVPDHASIVLAPWMDDVATYVMANEGDRLAMRLTYVAGSGAGPVTFVSFLAGGQLLLATGEPFEQLVGSPPPSPPPPPPPAPEPERWKGRLPPAGFPKLGVAAETRPSSPISVAEQMQRKR